MPYKRILANNLITFRANEKVTQREFALGSAVSKDTISMIERELTNVRLNILEKMASYMGLTLPELFTEGFVKKYMLKEGVCE